MREAVVWVDPGRQGGAPCVMGTRIPTETVARYFWQLGMAETLTAYPHITREQVLGACWFAVRFGRKRWRKRWGAWADRYGARMWSGDWADVPEPPSEAAGAPYSAAEAVPRVPGPSRDGEDAQWDRRPCHECGHYVGVHPESIRGCAACERGGRVCHQDASTAPGEAGG